MKVWRKIVVRLRNHCCQYNATMPFHLHCWRTNDAVSNVIKYWKRCHGNTTTLSPYSCATRVATISMTHTDMFLLSVGIFYRILYKCGAPQKSPDIKSYKKSPSIWEPRWYTRMYGETDKRTDRYTGGMKKPTLMGAFHKHDNGSENGSNE